MASAAGKKRHYITLKVREGPWHEAGIRQRSLTVGRLRLPSKESIKSLYKSDLSASRKKMSCVSTSEDSMYEWYSIACFYPGGPLIVEKAKQIAGKLEFKGLMGG